MPGTVGREVQIGVGPVEVSTATVQVWLPHDEDAVVKHGGEYDGGQSNDTTIDRALRSQAEDVGEELDPLAEEMASLGLTGFRLHGYNVGTVDELWQVLGARHRSNSGMSNPALPAKTPGEALRKSIEWEKLRVRRGRLWSIAGDLARAVVTIGTLEDREEADKAANREVLVELAKKYEREAKRVLGEMERLAE